MIKLALVVVIASSSPARDLGQYSQVNPAQRDWYDALKDKGGVSCCRSADGYDAQWDTMDGHYRVFIDGAPYVVPDAAVLEIPNIYGAAKVWYTRSDGNNPLIRCFIPGSMT